MRNGGTRESCGRAAAEEPWSGAAWGLRLAAGIQEAIQKPGCGCAAAGAPWSLLSWAVVHSRAGCRNSSSLTSFQAAPPHILFTTSVKIFFKAPHYRVIFSTMLSVPGPHFCGPLHTQCSLWVSESLLAPAMSCQRPAASQGLICSNLSKVPGLCPHLSTDCKTAFSTRGGLGWGGEEGTEGGGSRLEEMRTTEAQTGEPLRGACGPPRFPINPATSIWADF